MYYWNKLFTLFNWKFWCSVLKFWDILILTNRKYTVGCLHKSCFLLKPTTENYFINYFTSKYQFVSSRSTNVALLKRKLSLKNIQKQKRVCSTCELVVSLSNEFCQMIVFIVQLWKAFLHDIESCIGCIFK